MINRNSCIYILFLKRIMLHTEMKNNDNLLLFSDDESNIDYVCNMKMIAHDMHVYIKNKDLAFILESFELRKKKRKMAGKKFQFEAFFLFLFLLPCISIFCNSLPLSTSSRWIVDHATGKRVKLACVNWVSHLQPMIAEGLEKKPLKYIAGKVSSMGFNCVRFTWATYMFTRTNYSKITVSQSLDNFGLKDAKAGIARNNPQLLSLSVVDLHKAVVSELGKNNIMVVLDNHVSQPTWCCSNNDGNGFFGDVNFDPKEWEQGLSIVARTYKDNPAVSTLIASISIILSIIL